MIVQYLAYSFPLKQKIKTDPIRLFSTELLAFYGNLEKKKKAKSQKM